MSDIPRHIRLLFAVVWALALVSVLIKVADILHLLEG